MLFRFCILVTYCYRIVYKFNVFKICTCRVYVFGGWVLFLKLQFFDGISTKLHFVNKWANKVLVVLFEVEYICCVFMSKCITKL